MSENATAPVMQRITHQIGDVRVTIEQPQDCPQPQVDLYYYAADSDAAGRVAAVQSLGLSNAPIKSHEGTLWQGREVQGCSAAVFLERSDFT